MIFKRGKYIYSFFVIITLAAILISLFMMYGLIRQNSEKTQENFEKSVFSHSVILAESGDLGIEYLDKIIFLGESTTYGLQKYRVLSGGEGTTQVWTGATVSDKKTVCSGTLSLSPTISSTRIFFPDTKEALTIGEALKIKKPEYLVITLGLNNGASYYTEDKFKMCYRTLLDAIKKSSGSTKIILQSLFPVAEYCSINAYTPERIIECNKWIYDMAEEYNLKYLNTFEVLVDENGYLKIEYDNGGDGIHLNRKGLMTVIDYIRTHGYTEAA